MKPWTDRKVKRSILFLPANDTRKAQKAATSSADCVVLDLEDAVSAEHKEAARANLLHILDTVDFGGRQVIVRVNAINSELGRSDIRAIADHPKVDAIILPMVTTAQDIDTAVSHTSKPLWLCAETPEFLYNIHEILPGHPQVKALVFGNNDLSLAMGVAAEEPMSYMRGAVMVAARANDLMIFDGPSRNLGTRPGDDDTIREESVISRRLGFDGKCVVHPFQLSVVNRAFTPDVKEVRLAEETVRKYQDNTAGAINVDGMMVEALHYAQAQELLTIHEAITHTGREKCLLR